MIEDGHSGPPRSGTSSFRLFSAILLISVGTLLFLGNLGLLPVRNIWHYWPLLIVVMGVRKMRKTGERGGQLTGGLVAFFGSIYLLISIGLIRVNSHGQSWGISMLLIGFGLALLIGIFEPGPKAWSSFDFRRTPPQDPENQIGDLVILGAVKRKLDAPNFQGGEGLCIFGNLEIDLRRARIPEPGYPVILDVTTVFGAVKIRVPESWRVIVNGVGLFGNYEDKTIPPVLGMNAPSLVVTGYSIFGTVEIED